ncbi:hypothetical protein BaRGS_00037031, partial [Batillaria attramentaria]
MADCFGFQGSRKNSVEKKLSSRRAGPRVEGQRESVAELILWKLLSCPVTFGFSES